MVSWMPQPAPLSVRHGNYPTGNPKLRECVPDERGYGPKQYRKAGRKSRFLIEGLASYLP